MITRGYVRYWIGPVTADRLYREILRPDPDHPGLSLMYDGTPVLIGTESIAVPPRIARHWPDRLYGHRVA